MNASALMLDFLYPKKALTYIRRVSGTTVARRSSQLSSRLSIRDACSDARLPRHYSSALSSSSARGAAFTPGTAGAVGAVPSLHMEQDAVPGELSRLLQLTPKAREHGAFDEAWILYKRLEKTPQTTTKFAREVLNFLSYSKRPLDAERILLLISDIDVAEWDSDTVSNLVKACLTLNQRSKAFSIYKQSSASQALMPGDPVGFDLLVADALKTSSWDLLPELWASYKEKNGRSRAEDRQLKAVTLLKGLRNRLQRFSDYVDRCSETGTEDNDSRRDENLDISPDERLGKLPHEHIEALQKARRFIVEVSLNHLDPADTLPLVQALKNPVVYEDFIRIAINKKRSDIAARAYTIYRRLSHFRPRTSTLMSMVRDVYSPDNVRGMEDVMKDWYNIKGRLNQWGYQKYLAFYASRGDVTSVYRLWNEYTEAFPSAIQDREDTFAHLLNVHAVRGDLSQAEKVFREISEKYHVQPSTPCWNIRLHIHVERGRYAEAMSIFHDLCEAVEPDDYSFATIMAIVGKRGDTSLVSRLYTLAQQRGLRITEAMVDSIVESYCQNDRLDEAEKLCMMTTRDGTAVGKPYTALWNTLLHNYALRHDLVAVNRILKVMTQLDVKYDSDTYSALLFALAQCRQPRRAVELLRAAQERGIFRPKAEHYILLMMAYIRSKQPLRALQVNRLMHHMGFRRESEQIRMVIKAFSQWQDFVRENKSIDEQDEAAERRELFAKALREFQRSLSVRDNEASAASRSNALRRESPRLHLGAVRRFSFVIFMLVQAGDFAGVDELMQLYQSIVPEDEKDQPLPLKLCNALLLSDYYEGRVERAKEMWTTVLERSREIGRPQTFRETRLESILGPANAYSNMRDAPRSGTESSDVDDGKIVARLRYSLSDPLKTMQRVFADERDADALIRLINEDVLGNGFLLDSKNWNHYVQHLARLGRMKEAFTVCEEELMDQWTGFLTTRAKEQQGGGEGGRESDEASGHSAGSQPPMDLKTPDGTTGSDPAALPKGDRPIDEATYLASSTAASAVRLLRAKELRESASRHPRPMTYTFVVLAKAYLELEQMAPWSSAAERLFHDLAVRCPKTVHAVRAMALMHSRIEGRVFAGDSGPDRGLDALLRPLATADGR